MTKILNFGLKIKGVVGRVARAKSSDPATPPKKKFETCTRASNGYLHAVPIRPARPLVYSFFATNCT